MADGFVWPRRQQVAVGPADRRQQVRAGSACRPAQGGLEVRLEGCGGLAADLQEGQQHVERVEQAGVHIDCRLHARAAQVLHVGQRLGVKRLAGADEGVGGRQA